MASGLDISQYSGKLSGLDDDSLGEVQGILNQIQILEDRKDSQEDFMTFTKRVWPEFIEGNHHKIMADAFTRIGEGKLKRLIITMAPRHSKSEFASYLLPSWYLGNHPKKKVIQATHTADLAKSFGLKVKDLIETDENYRAVFPGVSLKKDEKASGKWRTNQKGEYFAVGVNGALAGRGADLLIIDDPHAEKDVLSANDKSAFDAVYDWYVTGPRQRLQPNAAIVIVMTRWSKRDLAGRILQKAEEDGDEDWEIIEFPAILNEESETPLPVWPEYWSLKELLKLKKELPVQRWTAQYQQNPSSQETSIIKEDWWKVWDGKDPPECEMVIQSWDTAFSAKEAADPSACVEIGIFYLEGPNGKKQANVILLDAFSKRMEFPDLKKEAWERYKRKQPDIVLIEAKSSGTPLIQELRTRGVPVQDFTGSVRGNDKTVRVNSISDLFSSGLIWYPKGKDFAKKVIYEFSEFPVGDHDDLVDAMTQALIRFRLGGFISMDTDYEDDEEDWDAIDASSYYG